MNNDFMSDLIAAEVAKVLPWTKKVRHQLHQNPELTWQERNTSQLVRRCVAEVPDVSVETIAETGVVCTLKGDAAGPTIALRGDMDALPIVEQNTELAYCSRNVGVMHACGHDGHTANLLGSLKVIAALRSRLQGAVKFIFQPAEEGGAGGRVMCEAGALKNPDVDAIFGMHAWPELPMGEVMSCSGPMMAGNAMIDIVIAGKGGHAAMPDLATDQVLAGARLVQSLMNIRARRIAPAEAFCLTITKFEAGTAHNIIPDKVVLAGTMRATSREVLDYAAGEVKKLCATQAQEIGGQVDVKITPLYPPVVNNKKAYDFFAETADAVLGQSCNKHLLLPTMGAEDFSYYLREVPGAFFFLGMALPGTDAPPSLHHPKFDFNDEAFETSLTMFSQLALRFADHW